MKTNQAAYERVLEECEQLNIRIALLEKVDTDNFPPLMGGLLKAQLHVMQVYYNILQARITIWEDVE